MWKIENDRMLRDAYEMLAFYQENLEMALDHEKALKHIAEAKREIRRYTHLPVSNDVVVKDEGMDGAIVLVTLPETLKTKADAEAYFEECKVIRARPSMYDCTGQMFTVWYKVFSRRGRFMAYHSVAFDV